MSAHGLHYRDLAQWQRWNDSLRPTERALRTVRARLRTGGTSAPRAASGSPGTTSVLYLPSGTMRALVVVDRLSPSCTAAVVEPLRHLDPTRTGVLAPTAITLPASATHGREATDFTGVQQLPATIDAVLSLGAYLPASAPVQQWAASRDVPFLLVQHGLLTPWAPPAPAGAHVLAWCDGDAEFWTTGRPDLTVTTTGSQMLWAAATAGAAERKGERPVVLGQLHGTELTRHEAFRTYWDFCRAHGSDYRPHPNENDAVSRALHRAMRRGGIAFETSGTPLIDLGRPVVSIFSTGTLEAAHPGG